MVIILLFVFFSSNTLAAGVANYVCGTAKGFQPFQYEEDNQAKGLDILLFKIISEHSNVEVKLKPMAWRDALAQLEFGILDCVIGMEMSRERLERFKFAQKIYDRKIRIFVPLNSSISTLKQLEGKIVANDRSSELLTQLKKDGIAKKIRLLDVATKTESLVLMKKNKVVAVIGPKRVVTELAKSSSFKVKEVKGVGVDVPVSIAFKNADHPLLKIITDRLNQQSIRIMLDDILNK